MKDVGGKAVEVKKSCRSRKGTWDVDGEERPALVETFRDGIETFRDGVEDKETVSAEVAHNIEDRSGDGDAEERSEIIVEVGKETVHTHNTDVEVVNMEPIEEYDLAREPRFVHELMRPGKLNLVEGVELLQELREPIPEPITEPALVRALTRR